METFLSRYSLLSDDSRLCPENIKLASTSSHFNLFSCLIISFLKWFHRVPQAMLSSAVFNIFHVCLDLVSGFRINTLYSLDYIFSWEQLPMFNNKPSVEKLSTHGFHHCILILFLLTFDLSQLLMSVREQRNFIWTI